MPKSINFAKVRNVRCCCCYFVVVVFRCFARVRSVAIHKQERTMCIPNADGYVFSYSGASVCDSYYRMDIYDLKHIKLCGQTES